MTKISREIKTSEIVTTLREKGKFQDVWATGFIPNSDPQMPPHYVLKPTKVSISEEIDDLYGQFKISHNKQDYWEPSHATHFFTTKKIANVYFKNMVEIALQKHANEAEIVVQEMEHVHEEIQKYKPKG